MRARVERVASGAFVAVTVAAGAVAVVAPVWLEGFVLGGSACGGGGNAIEDWGAFLAPTLLRRRVVGRVAARSSWGARLR